MPGLPINNDLRKARLKESTAKGGSMSPSDTLSSPPRMSNVNSETATCLQTLQEKADSLVGKQGTGIRHLFQVLADAPVDELSLLGHKMRHLMTKHPFKQLHFVPSHIGSSSAQLLDVTEDEEFLRLVQPSIDSGNNLLQYDRLYTIYQSLKQLARQYSSRTLVTLEAGVYRGQTSAFICRVLEAYAPGRAKHYAIDTFEGHSEADLPTGVEGAHKPGLFGDTSFQAVRDLLEPFDFAQVLQGRVQDVAPGLSEQEYHFVHLDMDLREPTIWSFDFFTPRIPAGGLVVVDDLRKRTCPGIVEAITTYLDRSPSDYHFTDLQNAQGVLVRLPSFPSK